MASEDNYFNPSMMRCTKCGFIFDGVVVLRQRKHLRDRYALFDGHGNIIAECCRDCATYQDRLKADQLKAEENARKKAGKKSM